MLILASASPRRHELLAAAGIPHSIQPTHIPEVRQPRESPEQFVRRVALEKAEPVLLTSEDVVLSADTIVCCYHEPPNAPEVFGKPADVADAVRMLTALSGRTHSVHTAICLRTTTQTLLDLATTEVSFVPLTSEEIADYACSPEPYDKAGAYAIQGRASCFIEKINGSYQNVVGLPIALVYHNLRQLGFSVIDWK